MVTRILILLCFISLTALGQWTNNLLLWFKFDDGSGTTARDCSGNGNTGTLLNGMSSGWTTGKWGGGIYADYGMNNTVATGVISAMGNTNRLSICAWMRRIYPASFMCVGSAFAPGWGDNMQIEIQQDGYVFFRMANDYSFTLCPTGTDWHHYAFSFDGTAAPSGKMKAYIDGVLQSGIGNSGFTTITNTPTAGEFFVSRDRSSANYSYGDFDDVRVYSTNLSDADILSIYNNGASDGCLLPAIKTQSRIRR